MNGNRSVVRVNETILVKRNYEKGRELTKESQWIIDGVDTSTKEAFMTLISDRTKSTIKNVLEPRVNLDTIIHTDEWKSYILMIKKLGFKGHFTVCHKFKFVDRNAGVHTKEIEAFWGVFKR